MNEEGLLGLLKSINFEIVEGPILYQDLYRALCKHKNEGIFIFYKIKEDAVRVFMARTTLFDYGVKVAKPEDCEEVFDVVTHTHCYSESQLTDEQVTEENIRKMLSMIYNLGKNSTDAERVIGAGIMHGFIKRTD